jgi:hypothetical protein
MVAAPLIRQMSRAIGTAFHRRHRCKSQAQVCHRMPINVITPCIRSGTPARCPATARALRLFGCSRVHVLCCHWIDGAHIYAIHQMHELEQMLMRGVWCVCPYTHTRMDAGPFLACTLRLDSANGARQAAVQPPYHHIYHTTIYHIYYHTTIVHV